MKSRNLLLIFLICTFFFSLMTSIFSGKSASLAADQTQASSARGWAIGSAVVSSFNILLCILVLIGYFMLKKKESTD